MTPVEFVERCTDQSAPEQQNSLPHPHFPTQHPYLANFFHISHTLRPQRSWNDDIRRIWIHQIPYHDVFVKCKLRRLIGGHCQSMNEGQRVLPSIYGYTLHKVLPTSRRQSRVSPISPHASTSQCHALFPIIRLSYCTPSSPNPDTSKTLLHSPCPRHHIMIACGSYSRKSIALPTPVHVTRLILTLLPGPPFLPNRLMPRWRWVLICLHTRIPTFSRTATVAW
jgi:hypothetical protein